ADPAGADPAGADPAGPQDAGPKDQGPKKDIWQALDQMFRPGGEQEAESGPDAWANGEFEVPFERLDKHGFFPGLAKTARMVLLAPGRLFRAMPLRGMLRPLIFYLLLSEFQALCQFFWQLAGLGGMTGLGGESLETGILATGMGSFLILILYPLFLTGALLLMAAVNHFFLSLFRAASRGYEATFRPMAYSSATAVLSVIPVFGPLAGALCSIIITIIGWKNIHASTYPRVVAAFLIPVAILFVILTLVLRSTPQMV
ncbi:MAG: hypothetical protein JW718_01290, partial [Desulfovibrionaceae bacterium]|nr:hypothetical protein [Desulfovibrionaceae bacterium]